MSEESKQLLLIRFKNNPDDIVGLVTKHQKHITVEDPLIVYVETLFEEGRQILSIREYLPQTIVSIREVDFDAKEILFTTPVRDEFKDQYEQVAKFFYEEQVIAMEKPKKKKSGIDSENVVSLIEAIRDKKGKPVH